MVTFEFNRCMACGRKRTCAAKTKIVKGLSELSGTLNSDVDMPEDILVHIIVNCDRGE